jgi:hypothetical protein
MLAVGEKPMAVDTEMIDRLVHLAEILALKGDSYGGPTPAIARRSGSATAASSSAPTQGTPLGIRADPGCVEGSRRSTLARSTALHRRADRSTARRQAVRARRGECRARWPSQARTHRGGRHPARTRCRVRLRHPDRTISACSPPASADRCSKRRSRRPRTSERTLERKTAYRGFRRTAPLRR